MTEYQFSVIGLQFFYGGLDLAMRDADIDFIADGNFLRIFYDISFCIIDHGVSAFEYCQR